MTNTVDQDRTSRLFTKPSILSLALAAVAATVGFVGLSKYVHSPQGSRFGQSGWDIAYYDLQLFVLGSTPLEGDPPFNPWLQIGRYLAASATVSALVIAAFALVGESVRRSWHRAARKHVIVVGSTTEAQAIAAHLRQQRRGPNAVRNKRVLRIDDGDEDSLRSVGIARADTLYACVDDKDDSAVNVAIALAAASIPPRRRTWIGLGRRRHTQRLRVHVHVSDANLALPLQARRLMLTTKHGPHVDFFTMDELAAQQHVRGESFDLQAPEILVAGAGTFGRAVVVEVARQWRARLAQAGASPANPQVHITLVDPAAEDAARELTGRWPVVAEFCRFTTWTKGLDALLHAGTVRQPYRAYFCDEDEDDALRDALTAVTLWQGGKGSVVVRLHRLQRHGEAMDRLLESISDRLSVANVVDLAGRLAAEPKDTFLELAQQVHARYVAHLADLRRRGVVTGPLAEAEVEWAKLSSDLKDSNLALVMDLPNKLRFYNWTIAPRTDLVPAFGLRDEEVEPLARLEHERWMRERLDAGWKYGPRRDTRRKRNPDLLPWADLPEVEKTKDRSAVMNLDLTFEPELAERGLQIIRLTGAATA